MGPESFCLLLMLGMFAAFVVLPIAIVIAVVDAILKHYRKEKQPVQKPGEFAAMVAASAQRAKLDAAGRAAAAAEQAEAEAARAAALARRKKEKLLSAMKAEGRLDRLALVYYVGDALRSGMDAAAITAALKAKGWPDEEVEAAFSCQQGLPG